MLLEETQKGTLDITPWMEWFLSCLGRAIDVAQITLSAVLAKARFWDSVAGVRLNERQRRVLKIVCSTASMANSQIPNMQSLPSVPRTRLSVTFCLWYIVPYHNEEEARF